MKLSVLIVNMNTCRLVCQALDSLYANAPKCEFEVIVVDNASRDGSPAAIAAKYPNVILIRNQENSGFSAANNQALEIAKGDYLLLLNSDTMVTPGSLDQLLAAMEQEEELGVVAPRLIYPDGMVQMSYGPIPNLFVAFCTFFDVKRLIPAGVGRWFGRSGAARMAGKAGAIYFSWGSGTGPRTKLIDRDTYVTGACILIRRRCYEEVGGLDPRFFMYVDDADYSKRVHEAGWKILYCADSTIVHLQGGTAGKRYRWNSAPAYQSMLYFLKKHRGNWAYRAGKVFAVVAALGRWTGNWTAEPARRKEAWALIAELAKYDAR